MKGYIIATLIVILLNIIFIAWVTSDTEDVSRRARLGGLFIIIGLTMMAVIGIQLLTASINKI